jgi:23S rRNA pseudouridine2605 synthase
VVGPDDAGTPPGDHPGERLQKVLARAGVGSRRHADELVAAGRVTVNGEPAVPGRRVGPADRIELDGVPVVVPGEHVYYVLHKPAGVVTTAAYPQGRPMVVDLVPSEPRVFSVGRLDAETEGLLLLTNDGELAHRLTHPSHGVVKTYLAEVDGEPSRGALRRLREGVELDDGLTAQARVTVVARRGRTAAVEIGIHEGRNRQVRRMFDAVGHPVRRLVRTRIGPLRDERLGPGEWRAVTPAEVRALYEASSSTAPAPAAPVSSTGRDEAPG